MSYCIYCGSKLATKAAFCACCGKAVDESEQSRSTRRETYQGEVRKCPSCGAEVMSFTAFCSACGHEFNSARVSSSMQDFAERLHDYDVEILTTRQVESGWSSWSTAKKIGWVLLNIYLFGIPLMISAHRRKNTPERLVPISSKALSQQKASYIENYVFPNERETILEALLFIKAQASHYADESINRENAFWMKTWFNKATQLYQKAVVIMQDDQVADQAYYDIASLYQHFSKRQLIKRLIIIGAIVAFMVYSLAFGGNGA